MLAISLVLTSALGVLLAAPSAYHDQRQNGEYNIHSRLENFIVVLIPSSSLGSSSWLNFAKRIGLQDYMKHLRQDKGEIAILDKTPYAVEVEIQPKTSPSLLSRLHPSPVQDISSDVMVALSPSVSLSRSAEVPPAPEAATEATLHPPEVKPLAEPSKKPKSLGGASEELRLRLQLGAGLEVCASNERRGKDGNCEPIKARQRSGQFFKPSGLLPSLRFGLSPAND